MQSSYIQDALQKALATNEDPKPSEEPKPQTPRDTITVMKVLDKNKGLQLKVHSTGKVIVRKLSDIYWLQINLQTEFPFYYVI